MLFFVTSKLFSHFSRCRRTTDVDHLGITYSGECSLLLVVLRTPSFATPGTLHPLQFIYPVQGLASVHRFQSIHSVGSSIVELKIDEVLMMNTVLYLAMAGGPGPGPKYPTMRIFSYLQVIEDFIYY